MKSNKRYEYCRTCYYPLVCAENVKYVTTEKGAIKGKSLHCGLIVDINDIYTENFENENCCIWHKSVKCFNCLACLSQNGEYERDFQEEIIRELEKFPLADRNRKRFICIDRTWSDTGYNIKRKFKRNSDVINGRPTVKVWSANACKNTVIENVPFF